LEAFAMKNPQLVIIGSGSQFTEFFLQELFKFEEFRGCTLALVDRQPERLRHEVRLAQLLNAAVGWDVTVRGCPDRADALAGATHVYAFFAVRSKEAWKKEFEIAQRHGLCPFEAYTAGAPGLGFAIRHVPILLDLCADMERLCPDAWLILDNNPLAKLAAAVHRHARVRFVGYCNGHELVQLALEQLLDLSDRAPSARSADPVEREFMVPAGSIEITLAGINHLQWLTAIRHARTGEDLYPRLRERCQDPQAAPSGYQFSAEVCRRFGWFPSPADNHIGDYLWVIDEAVKRAFGLVPYPVDQWFGGRDAAAWARTADSVQDPAAARHFITRRRVGWMNLQIARDLVSGAPSVFPAVNVVNEGVIPNLPDDAIVEVPAVIGQDAIRPLRMEPLPAPLAAFCGLHAQISNLAAEAAATGSKELARQALLLDPFIHSATTADRILDDLLAYCRQFETRFS
jgi:alpha-galactosidase